MQMHRLAAAFLVLALTIPAAGAERDAASIKAWREDLAYLRDRMPVLHRDLFHDLSRADYDRLFLQLMDAVPRLGDHEIVVEISRIVAAVGPRDGHTNLNPLQPATGFHILPAIFYVYSDGVHVRAVSKEHAALAGARVVAIGGTPVDDALQRVAAITPADNPFDRKSRSVNYLMVPEVLRALKIAPGEPGAPVAFDFVLPDGKPARVTLRPGKLSDEVEWVRAGAETPLYRRFAPVVPFGRASKPFWYEYMPETKLLYVNFNAVANAEDETVEAFFKRVFDFADANPVEKFVLDIRNNGGGNNYLNRPIFYGLVKRADTLAGRGRFFTIIGRETYSAAQNLANLIDIHTAAIFVGEPTGGAPNHFGDSIGIELPNSKLQVRVATLWWQDADPRDARLWISPAIAAEMSSQDERSGRDPALEAILRYEPQPPLSDRLRAAFDRGALEALEKEFVSWKSAPAHRYLTGEGALNSFAVALYREKKPEQALAVFELNARVNPDSWLAHNSLARAYESAERNGDALRHYQKALELDPRAAFTMQAIERLRRAP
ncbi:MAG TPA: tetratricopeptide repeat protein [Thermoanaerobaculia bacterium]|nr:tetratricopeptide repeat protein [Thermoanaerobaculia bacterium]